MKRERVKIQKGAGYNHGTNILGDQVHFDVKIRETSIPNSLGTELAWEITRRKIFKRTRTLLIQEIQIK